MKESESNPMAVNLLSTVDRRRIIIKLIRNSDLSLSNLFWQFSKISAKESWLYGVISL